MRVSELAGIAGVSVRTIRHYHTVGLLPVPPRAGAWRDYGVDDVSRLLRIRALADAGIPLSDVGAHLDGDAPMPDAAGLDEAIDAIDARIAALREQRERLLEMRGDGGGRHSGGPMPELTAIYDSIGAAIRELPDGDEESRGRALTLLHRKRLLTEIAARVGLIDDHPVAHLGTWDPVESARYFHDFARLTEPGWSEEAISELVDKGLEMMPDPATFPPSLIRAFRWFADDGPGRSLAIAAYPAPGQRRYIELAFERIERRIKEIPND